MVSRRIEIPSAKAKQARCQDGKHYEFFIAPGT